METTTVNPKGQVTIPRELRNKLGIAKGSKLGFSLVGDHIELWVLNEPTPTTMPGFGMLKSRLPSVPADFDPANVFRRQQTG
ncbi:MAG: AbrB/MazE/SpoVT family DNA-binding domain-containing protein [Candidatus Methylumidiphilus sp.]